MDLRALKYFETVFETRSVSAAARQSHISQPSISSAIQQLEQSLDVQLFIRHHRGVTPTSAADRLYPLSKKLTGDAKGILKIFHEKTAPVPLCLGLMRSLGAQRMSLLLKELVNAIANLELTLVNPEENCDARIVSSSTVSIKEAFEPIWEDRYQLALPRNYPLSFKKEILLSDLDELPFINRAPCDAIDQLKDAMKELQIAFQTRANIRTIEYAQALVSAGVGAAILPNWEEIRATDDIVLRPISDLSLNQTIGLAYNRTKRLDPLLQTTIELCRDYRSRAGRK
ncbi:MAG: LysR family transcriptional regulator [SAR324 cluster bacterium]|uniref:LysR family transcriptional regulator n=1 Tax=SAR324 cluster bacterium TaxID=2024889 RepID=A0A2A4T847_9DELT|nr:MAG: LysR family transcriptional regulator [SAR324 cluster bacterium]